MTFKSCGNCGEEAETKQVLVRRMNNATNVIDWVHPKECPKDIKAPKKKKSKSVIEEDTEV